MKKIFVYAAVTLLILLSCNHLCSSQTLKASYEERLEALVLKNELPGMRFSIIYPEGDQIDCAAGFADTEKGVLLDTEHIMFSGSIGKTYAVAVLMQLYEEGKIDLDARFIEYFPETAWLKRLPNMERITVRQLLEHTSGLPRYIDQQGVWDSLYNNPDKVWNYEDRFAFILDKEPVHEAGNGWFYSDSNYLLIGMLIEKTTGSPYYKDVEDRILDKEGLRNTVPGISREILNLPMGYSGLPPFFRMPEKVVKNGKYAFNPQMEWTGGGFASTTGDLARWAKAYYTAKYFSAESLDQITSINPNGDNLGDGLSYGMGSFVFETEYGRMWGHTGFVPGFLSIFGYFPETSIALALQVNCDYATRKKSLEQFLEDLLEVSRDK